MPHDHRSIPKQFGLAVRKLRTDRGISQMALAERAGLTLNFVGSVERAEKVASIESVVRIARGLGVKGSDLLAVAKL